MSSAPLVFVIGLLAQTLFSARILCQWVLSERARQVVSPTIFWVLSLAASYLLCLYGWLRDDFPIILGQFISYYIYLWNLKSKGVLQQLHAVIRAVLLLTPVIAAGWVMKDATAFVDTFFHNPDVPLYLVLFGSAGQVIFTLRFVYQWFYSMRRNTSVLPAGFWIISLVGSSIIIAYACYRRDPVLLLGQSLGFVAYSRNLIIGYKHAHASKYSKS